MDIDSFFKFVSKYDSYLPIEGEGDTQLSQMVTAINKICYKWFNDGDVYDNTYHMEGWCNNLSTYANWLFQYTTYKAKDILSGIKDCSSEEDYTDLLYSLCSELIRDSIFDMYRDAPKIYSIYKCEGPFKWESKE